MRLRNMIEICLVFLKSEPQYAYKRYAYKKNMYFNLEERITHVQFSFTYRNER